MVLARPQPWPPSGSWSQALHRHTATAQAEGLGEASRVQSATDGAGLDVSAEVSAVLEPGWLARGLE